MNLGAGGPRERHRASIWAAPGNCLDDSARNGTAGSAGQQIDKAIDRPGQQVENA